MPAVTRVRAFVFHVLRMVGTAFGWMTFALGCLVWTVLAVPPTLALRPIWRGVDDAFYAATRAALRLYVRTLPFMKLAVEREEPTVQGTHVLVGNHQSWLDPILMMAIERRVSGPARDYMFRIPALRTIMRILGFYPVGGALPVLEALRQGAREALEEDRALLFFPEGTRTRTGEVGPFHRGACRIAFDHHLPIQPFAIEGMDRVLPAGTLVAQTALRHLVRIRYLEPIEPPYGTRRRRDAVRALTELARQRVVEGLEEMRSTRSERTTATRMTRSGPS